MSRRLPRVLERAEHISTASAFLLQSCGNHLWVLRNAA